MSPLRYRYLREKLGTQAEVAELLGVKQGVISKRESGCVTISKESAIAIESLAAKVKPRPCSIQVTVISREARDAEKAASRLRDLQAIESGEMTAAEIQAKNGLFDMAPNQVRVISNLREALSHA